MTAPNKQNGLSLENWAKMCTGKQRYSDDMAARSSAQNSLLKDRSQRSDYLWVYKCPGCRGFHMTSKFGRECESYGISKTELYCEVPPVYFTSAQYTQRIGRG